MRLHKGKVGRSGISVTAGFRLRREAVCGEYGDAEPEVSAVVRIVILSEANDLKINRSILARNGFFAAIRMTVGTSDGLRMQVNYRQYG